MYYLSKICCFCLRSNIRLKHLNKITNFCTSLTDIIKILIGESVLSELGHVLSICKDCTKRVNEVHSFWQTCINNNKILTKYLRQLRILGNDFGHIRVQINDIMYSTDPVILMYKDKFCENESIYAAENNVVEDVKLVIKNENLDVKDEDYQECTRELSGNENDTTAYKTPAEENSRYKDQTNREEEEFKIETHDFKEIDPLKCESNEMESVPEIQENIVTKMEDFDDEDDRECSQELAGNGGDATACNTSENEKELKIDVQDDFKEIYGRLKYESNETQVEYPEEPIEEHSEQYKREGTSSRNSDTSERLPTHCSKTCSVRKLKSHNLKRIAKKLYKCQICGKSFTQNWILTRHVLVHADKKLHKCQTCGKSFTFKGNLTRHTLVHTGEKPHVCQTCGKSFPFKDHLTRHILVHTSEKPHKCQICGKSFATKIHLTSHMLLHTGEKPHKCPTCGKSFISKGNLTSHMLLHTGEKPHKCKTCGKSFTFRSTLTSHMLIHTGEKPHKCETCGKSFTQRNTLINHLLTHTCEKPYECEICGKSFTQRIALTIHMLIHSGEKPHKCETCGKSFTSKGHLTSHMLLHSGEKAHKCLTCGKPFTFRSTLTNHMLTHTGEKPHKCETCGKSFTQKSTLTGHLLVHTGEKPYECITCGKSFNDKGNLKRHNSLHANNKLHKCETCDLFFECRQSVHSDENHRVCKKCK